MRLNRLVMTLTCTGLFAACGTDSATTVAETAAALESVQSDFCAFRAQADACRATYDACLAVEGADLAACRTALHECLPPPPARPEGSGRCEGPRGGGHHGGGHGAPIVQPDPSAVQACRDALTACQAADATDPTCKDTERSCVRDAFRAAFEAACVDTTQLCTTLSTEACTRLNQRCTEGIDGRVDSDGGVCAAAPAVIP